MNGLSTISPQGGNAGTASGASEFDSLVGAGSGAPAPGSGITVNGRPLSEVQAQQEIAVIANDPDSSALKMQLAQQGISLTDNSDVGPGERFETFADKLGYVMNLKMKLLVAIMMSMVSGGGSPSGSEEITDARDALKGARTQA